MSVFAHNIDLHFFLFLFSNLTCFQDTSVEWCQSHFLVHYLDSFTLFHLHPLGTGFEPMTLKQKAREPVGSPTLSSHQSPQSYSPHSFQTFNSHSFKKSSVTSTFHCISMNNVAKFAFIFIPKDFMVFTYPCFDTAVDFGVIITTTMD